MTGAQGNLGGYGTGLHLDGSDDYDTVCNCQNS